MTALDLLDRTIASLPVGDPIRKALLLTRAQVAEQEDTINEARQTIEKMEEVIKKVTSPANRIGIFLGTTATWIRASASANSRRERVCWSTRPTLW